MAGMWESLTCVISKFEKVPDDPARLQQPPQPVHRVVDPIFRIGNVDRKQHLDGTIINHKLHISSW